MGEGTYLAEVKNALDGNEIGALFDFDGTIIAGYSATSLIREKLKRREMGAQEIIGTLNTIAQYQRGNIGFSGLMSAAARFMRGISEQSFIDFGEELYEKHIARKVYPETRELIQAHLAKGHTVAIVSSATIYQIEPAARDLDIDYICCSAYEVKDGEFTGEVRRPLCFGEGKVLAAEKLADQTGINLDESYFYTDSDDDIELLERVGKPRPLNPNRRLSDIAIKNNWPVEGYNSRGRHPIGNYLRSFYATGSLFGAAAAGGVVEWLTGSRREALNFATGFFGDIASAIAGVEMEIEGEEHLWTKRPAIFLFNHQSFADMMIVAKLVRKDIAGVGKKELRDIPFIGKVMERYGTVFVDRGNRRNAIEAMKPLVDVILKDKRSVVIAPEGTRTVSPKLNPFKKGAFHLALQTRVPVIPVIIHNALDIAPKGEVIMRPGKVQVTVLPPIETKKWTKKNINGHVKEVRDMFLETLKQGEEEAKAESDIAIQADTEPNIKKAIERDKKVKTKTGVKKKIASKAKKKTGPSSS